MVIGPLLIVGLVSVASVETTGKGLADHGISAVRDQDCKISRSIRGDDICRDLVPEPRTSVTVQPAPAKYNTNSVQSMEDVFAQRRNRANQKIDK